MMRRKATDLNLLLLALVTGVVMAACAGVQSYAPVHPEEVRAMPLCSECHDDWQSAYDHTAGFAGSHRFYSSRGQAVCESCHRLSFCSDCHGDKEELKPSDKFKDAPQRTLPHRGDYLTLHRIDGKIDPVP
jgi:hypothetical protein